MATAAIAELQLPDDGVGVPPGSGGGVGTPPGRPGTKPRALVISAGVGAGHDGAAAAIATALTEDGCTVERADFLDLLPGRSGRWLSRAYATQLRLLSWTWGPLLRLLGIGPVAATVGRVVAALVDVRLRALVTGTEAVVVSTYPLASQALGRQRRTGALAAPVVTFLCDPSVHPLWIAAGVDHHVALYPEAARQARRRGAVDVSLGEPAVSRAFRPLDARERATARARWGLPAGPVAVVVGGSGGVGRLAAAARHIARSGLATPVTVCGHNAGLRRRLVRGGHGIALGWVDDMASLIGSADVVIQNAGGLSCLEATAAGVPLITYLSLSGHGATNAAVLRDAALVPWPRTRRAFVTQLRSTVECRPVAGRPVAAPPVIVHLRQWMRVPARSGTGAS